MVTRRPGISMSQYVSETPLSRYNSTAQKMRPCLSKLLSRSDRDFDAITIITGLHKDAPCSPEFAVVPGTIASAYFASLL